MNDKHPITPPTELVEQWYETADNVSEDVIIGVANRAAQWGADQELNACCEQLHKDGWHTASKDLHAARRPKPLSEVDQALETLNFMESEASYDKPMIDTIRRPLERLKKMEALSND